MFEIGQHVVCIDDANQNTKGKKFVHKGHIYTIRWIGTCRHPTLGDMGLCVRVEGIVRGWPDLVERTGDESWDMPFGAWRFSPLKECQTDISVFTALLNPQKIEEVV
jgi:hypothetical protein